jgi:FlaA1/EpsC-like NDP-sugar epimerase
VWRYASIDELVAVVAAVATSSLAGYSLVYALLLTGIVPNALGFPRSIPVIDTVLVFLLAGAWRFAFRAIGVGRLGSKTIAGLQRALIVGSGGAALSVIRELRAGGTEFGLAPVGVLADDIPLGQRLFGLQVLGSIADLTDVIRREHVAVVLLGLPTADGRTLRRLVRLAESAGARCLTVPSVSEVMAGRVSMDALREIVVEDLLRRAPARIDMDSVSATFRGRRILVTGAGGSIGSELVRQLIPFGPSEILLLGRGENSIFEVMQTLPKGQAALVTPVILDIRERDRLHALFAQTHPEVVFHAAAHKHVYLMELYPEEAVGTNILGTANLVRAATAYGVERFVLISTDKAVNPRSVMGATKRVAELVIQDAAARTGVRFATVRFGNVLSSRGSVVPIFRRQLEQNGPLTVTDPAAQRYFMTIPEAVQLVLQAGALASPGDTFVLDMGEPVRIVDLARDLIELHGMKEGVDVDIAYIGLRQGEKLTEELIFPFERVEPTSHEAVLRVPLQPDVQVIEGDLDELADLVHPRHRDRLLTVLQRLVPQYAPALETQKASSDATR